jgi:pantothenate synthetase
MTENHTPKKNNLSLILKVGIVLLILAGVCSAVFYQYIYLPGKIVASVNTNADIFNAVIRDNNALAIKSEVKLSGNTATSSSELSRQIENAKNIQTATDNLSQKIEDTSKKIDDGPNTDSKEYATIVRDSLNQRLALTKENLQR